MATSRFGTTGNPTEHNLRAGWRPRKVPWPWLAALDPNSFRSRVGLGEIRPVARVDGWVPSGERSQFAMERST